MNNTRRSEILRTIGVKPAPVQPRKPPPVDIQPPVVENVEEFDCLPEGSEFIDSRDGQMKVKG